MDEFHKMFEYSKWFKFGYWTLSVAIVSAIILIGCTLMSVFVDVGYWVRHLIFRG